MANWLTLNFDNGKGVGRLTKASFAMIEKAVNRIGDMVQSATDSISNIASNQKSVGTTAGTVAAGDDARFADALTKIQAAQDAISSIAANMITQIGLQAALITALSAQETNQKQTVTASGALITMGDDKRWLAMIQSSLLAAQTVKLPNPANDGERIIISTKGAITLFTLQASGTGVSVSTGSFLIAANGAVMFGYDLGSKTWLRLQ